MRMGGWAVSVIVDGLTFVICGFLYVEVAVVPGIV